MVQYKKSDARAWTRENMKGVANVVIPSYTQDLEKLSEKGIRHDIRTCINYGFWGTLLVSEVAITVDEYTQFVRWSHDEAGGKGQQRKDEAGGGIEVAEELLGDERSQRAVQIEVVPLEHSAQR